MGTLTDPESLGACEPGTAISLEGIVWNETKGGNLHTKKITKKKIKKKKIKKGGQSGRLFESTMKQLKNVKNEANSSHQSQDFCLST